MRSKRSGTIKNWQWQVHSTLRGDILILYLVWVEYRHWTLSVFFLYSGWQAGEDQISLKRKYFSFDPPTPQDHQWGIKLRNLFGALRLSYAQSLVAVYMFLRFWHINIYNLVINCFPAYSFFVNGKIFAPAKFSVAIYRNYSRRVI